MNSSEGTVTCETCGHYGPLDQVKVWHPFRHPLALPGEDTPNPFSKKKPAQQQEAPMVSGPVVSSMPFDPVLRQALIDKGILTPQDLRDAEQKISAITGMMIPATGGEQT